MNVVYKITDKIAAFTFHHRIDPKQGQRWEAEQIREDRKEAKTFVIGLDWPFENCCRASKR